VGHWVLAGDIGGTKTAIGLFRPSDLGVANGGRKNPPVPIVSGRYKSRDYEGLVPILAEFMKAHDSDLGAKPVGVATFGVAGPVIGSRSETTNLPWTIDADEIASFFGWAKGSVRLINDLVAMGWGINLVAREDFATLREGIPEPGGNGVLVAPGTGLGEAFLFREGTFFRPLASEGGHVDWAPFDREQALLLEYLWKTYPHVSVERILSGPGLVHVFRFLTRDGASDPLLSADIPEEDLPARISAAALEGQSEWAVQTLSLFSLIMAQEVGNMALKGLATGGVFLGGGIPCKVLPFLKSDAFLSRVSEKGRYRSLLEKIPVRVLMDESTPLFGAALEAGLRADRFS
jgi:glucokinase